MKPMTQKERDKIIAKQAAKGREWIDQGYPLDRIARRLEVIFAYTCEVKDGKIRIWAGRWGHRYIHTVIG